MLKEEILNVRRKYFIDKVQVPLMKAITTLALRYDEPTKENTRKPNSHVLLDIYAELLERLTLKERHQLFKAARKLHVNKYEVDDFYAEIFEWFVEKLVEAYLDGRWIPSVTGSPTTFWDDPDAKVKLALARMKYVAEGADNADRSG